MSAQVCSLIESILLPLLPPQHRRADCKLTPSERERVAQALTATWKLAEALSDDRTALSAQNELQRTRLPDLLRTKELATFLFTIATQADRGTVATALRQEEAVTTTEPYNDSRITKGFSEILSEFVDRVIAERGGSYVIPDGAPMDICSFFDQWQNHVEECIPFKR